LRLRPILLICLSRRSAAPWLAAHLALDLVVQHGLRDQQAHFARHPLDHIRGVRKRLEHRQGQLHRQPAFLQALFPPGPFVRPFPIGRRFRFGISGGRRVAFPHGGGLLSLIPVSSTPRASAPPPLLFNYERDILGEGKAKLSVPANFSFPVRRGRAGVNELTAAAPAELAY
jgi:hypothetical protein